MADDERGDAVLIRQRQKRRQVAIEFAARQTPERLRGESEWIGEGESHADAPEVEAQGAAAGMAQFELGLFGVRSAFGAMSAGAGFVGACALFGETAATRSAIA